MNQSNEIRNKEFEVKFPEISVHDYFTLFTYVMIKKSGTQQTVFVKLCIEHGKYHYLPCSCSFILYKTGHSL